jgi:hypothetical protein
MSKTGGSNGSRRDRESTSTRTADPNSRVSTAKRLKDLVGQIAPRSASARTTKRDLESLTSGENGKKIPGWRRPLGKKRKKAKSRPVLAQEQKDDHNPERQEDDAEDRLGLQIIHQGHEFYLNDTSFEEKVQELRNSPVFADGLLGHLADLIDQQPVWPELAGARRTNVVGQLNVVQYKSSYDSKMYQNIQCVIKMPRGEDKFCWYMWPEQCNKPAPDLTDSAIYRVVWSFGKRIQVPRMEMTVGLPYNGYGDSDDNVQIPIPHDMGQLLGVVNSMRSLQMIGKLNGVLINVYRNGAQSVDQHQDNESCIENNHQIFCAVYGSTRALDLFSASKKSSPGLAKVPARRLFGVTTPPGLYCMSGPTFQVDYTHGIAKIYLALLQRIRKRLDDNPDLLPDYPRSVPLTSDGVDRKNHTQFVWIDSHQDKVREQLQMGGSFVLSTATQKSVDEDLARYEVWRASRTSITFRNLRPPCA